MSILCSTDDFIQNKQVDKLKTVPFHDQLKRLKLKTFTSKGESKRITSRRSPCSFIMSNYICYIL